MSAATVAASGGMSPEPYFLRWRCRRYSGVMTALMLAFVMGLGMAFCGSVALRRGFGEFRDIITRTIMTVIIPLLPLYIFGIFMEMTMAGQVGPVLRTFVSIIGVIFVMHVVLLVVQFCVAGAVAGKNPLKMLRLMLPAYFTALGTQVPLPLSR